MPSFTESARCGCCAQEVKKFALAYAASGCHLVRVQLLRKGGRVWLSRMTAGGILTLYANVLT